MLRPEFEIAADRRVDRNAADLEDMGKLRPDRRDFRPEPAEKPLAKLAERRIGGIGVVGHLVIEITGE